MWCQGGGGIGIWLCSSSMCLLRMRYHKYCMDIVFPLGVEMDDLGSLRDCIVGVWMTPPTPAVSMINGWTCQPNVHNLSNTRLYFCSLNDIEYLGILS